mmetsp:Transcript_88476/g.250792  ORF Transcript_88476/g.250792 Transcript_88476/m.250792 type:complete len:189 (+) Transcript_88476:651-1217(+)
MLLRACCGGQDANATEKEPKTVSTTTVVVLAALLTHTETPQIWPDPQRKLPVATSLEPHTAWHVLPSAMAAGQVVPLPPTGMALAPLQVAAPVVVGVAVVVSVEAFPEAVMDLVEVGSVAVAVPVVVAELVSELLASADCAPALPTIKQHCSKSRAPHKECPWRCMVMQMCFPCCCSQAEGTYGPCQT